MPTFLAGAFKTLITKIVLSAFSQKFLEWAFFSCAESLVKSTKNTLDDEALAKLKEQYFEQNK